MPIRFLPETENGSKIVRAGLHRLSQRKSPLELSKEAFNALTLESFHSVYDLGANDVASGGGLESARLTGYRYIIKSAGKPVAAAELVTSNSSDLQLTNLNFGRFVELTSQALEKLVTIDSVHTGSYETRLLRFSAIYVIAIWLKDDGGETDIIYPLDSIPHVLKADKLYTVNDFFNAIRPLAEKRIKDGRNKSIVP